jgi:hypothetical protein
VSVVRRGTGRRSAGHHSVVVACPIRQKHERLASTRAPKGTGGFIVSCFLFLCPPGREFDRRHPG